MIDHDGAMMSPHLAPDDASEASGAADFDAISMSL